MKTLFKINVWFKYILSGMIIIFCFQSACYAIGGFGIVADSTPPAISILGEVEISHDAGNIYNDEGAIAVDNIDGDITSNIVTSNPVDVNMPGSYSVTYNVMDSAGNAAVEALRKVNVIDTTPKYNVTFISGGHGDISGTTSQTVIHSEDSTLVTAIPDLNYSFVNWTGDEFTTADVNPLIILNITMDLTITANFTINTYSVTFTAESNGSILGETSQIVNHGDNSASIRAVPEEYCRFTEWSGDYTGTENPLTITGVTEPMSITANFEREDDDSDGVDTMEEMGPDGDNVLYDGNNDGMPDSQQDNVVSFYISTGKYRTLELFFVDQDDVVRDARLEIIKNPDTSEIENYSPERFMGEPVNYSGGFYSFIAYCEAIMTACGNFTPEVKIYYHEALPTLEPGISEIATWCNSGGQCYDFKYSDTSGVGMLFPNRDGFDSTAVIKLKDGERGDSDGIKNGRIEY